jgi:hypothetical protein
MCLNCHQGRESTVSVNRIGDKPDDEVNEGLRSSTSTSPPLDAVRHGSQGAYEFAARSTLAVTGNTDL